MANSYVDELNELNGEYKQLETTHKDYIRKVEEAKAIQAKCLSAISHQRYGIKRIQDGLRHLQKTATPENCAQIKEALEKIEARKNQFRDLEDVLPHQNGIYLKIILGSVNVSLLSKRDKYKYKEDYETFKYVLSIIILGVAIMLFFVNYRVTDAAFQFLLVWYYCTLTIREHILKVNGSRIKGWWISHHFISTACAGILLIWPSGYTYSLFRNQFIVFSIYIALTQLLMYYYQIGLLYRLRSLGERRNMDVTVEGFTSWMWKGLGFILPFLILAYVFQLYNAYVLYHLSQDPQCKEWQVFVLSLIFMMLFLGNSLTLVAVVRQKIQYKNKTVEKSE